MRFDIEKIKGLAEKALPVDLSSNEMAVAIATLVQTLANEPDRLSREGIADAVIGVAFLRTSAFDAALEQFEQTLNVSKENHQ